MTLAAASSALRVLRVLVVEDDPRVQKRVREALKPRQLYLEECVTRTAMMSRLASNQRADVIVLDLALAGNDDIKLPQDLEEIKARWADTIVIGFSNTSVYPEDRKGTDAWIRKPDFDADPTVLSNALITAVLERLKRDLSRKQGERPDGAAKYRFSCGETRYTLKRPLESETVKELARHLGIVTSVTADDIEKHIHFHFQRLYHKPPDRWTDEEKTLWEKVLSHIDFEVYRAENPIPESRIGILVCVSPEKVVIRWNTAGEMAHDTREVPAELITVAEGWVVHAEIKRDADGRETWLSAWAEPPLKSNEQVIEEDMSNPAGVSLDKVPDADWPRIQGQ